MRRSWLRWAWLPLVWLAPACGTPVPPLNATAVTRAGGQGIDTAAALALVVGQQVYVPVYSHSYHRDQISINLTATVSIRNTSPTGRIIITVARYYNTSGALLREYTSAPVELPPLASLEYIIRETDSSGGSGANFIIDWFSDIRVSSPVIEAVMIGTAGAPGISFTNPGGDRR